MNLGDKKDSYGVISMLNHWAIGAAVGGLLIVGVTLTGMARGPEKAELIALHKAGGVTLLMFAFWRIYWRLRQGFPEAPAAHPPWQTRAATFMHWFLLIALVLMPLSGLAWSLTAGRPVSMFGLFEIPALARMEAASSAFQAFHRIFSKALMVAIVIHILAAVQSAATDFGKSGGRMFMLK